MQRQSAALSDSPSTQPEPAAPDRQTQIDQIQWYHEFDFGGGLQARSQTPDRGDHQRIWRFIEQQLEAIDFRGKTVLEIGTWDGYWSFYAERHGAKQVLATDDRTQNWATGEGIWLARELLKSRIEVRQDVSIYELSSLGRTFDIIICFGVYYHLLDPVHGLAQVRHCCHPDSLLLLEGDLASVGMAPNEARLNFNSEGQAFVPSAPLLEQLLRSVYFAVSAQAWMSPLPERRWYRRRRHRLHLDRAFTVCRPFAGVNDCHSFPPPFGLKAYDDRFRDAEPV